MAGYVERNLIPGEEVTYQAKLSLWHMSPQIIIGILTSWFVVGLVILLAVFIRYKSTELAITNKRVIAKFGFIRRKTIELNLKKVESMRVDQGIIGRIFNFGSVVVAGAGNPQAPIPGISAPMEFRKRFFELQETVGA
ncbi:PH domain-containing protein [Trinickia dinghuensis]|uniref:PH domain-containing protein n=1 Tax=Trinickia dinghuensis TaxID=2291023 RepID=A0A3D8JR24_9BURK|nr:PH domain-containing protein [Trinickia dinghuensis]RDU95165.1 PH domain-containing protein [Trinickia dinghuensis]